LLQDTGEEVILQREMLVGNTGVREIRKLLRTTLLNFKLAFEKKAVYRWWDRATAGNPTNVTPAQLQTELQMSVSCRADFETLLKLRKSLENEPALVNNPGAKANLRIQSKQMSDKIGEILEVSELF
jgi:hypothetical protein